MASKRKPQSTARAVEALASVKKQLVASFHDENVHAGFERVFARVPRAYRGAKPDGQPFTLWQLLEHLRLCAIDFLDYCRYPDYVEPKFPEGYWPESDAPPNDRAWQQSVQGFRSALRDLEQLLLDPSTDLAAAIGAKRRTVLRQVLACLDHNAYHLGQAVLLRRLLGIWDGQRVIR